MDRSTAAVAIVRAGARLGRRGLIAAAEGNVSCRLDDGSILVTPSGFRKDELTVDDLVDLDPVGVNLKFKRERKIKLAVQKLGFTAMTQSIHQRATH